MAKKSKLTIPSKEFEKSVIHSGSVIVDCQLCGRIHFGNNKGVLIEDLGKKEYKRLLKDSEKNSDKYVQHDAEMVSWGDIDGKQAVIGCQCNKLAEYENFFWNHRYIIEDYFSSIAQKELEDAKEIKNLAGKVKNAIGSIK
jgi:hypothetical protein